MATLNGQQLQPPAPTYNIGNGDMTTDYNQYQNYINTGRVDGNTSLNPGGQVSVPGVGTMSAQNALKYSNPNQPQNAPQLQGGVGEPKVQVPGQNPMGQVQATPSNQSAVQNTPQGAPTAPDLGPKYQTGLTQLNQSGGQAPTSGGEARTAVTQATNTYQPPQQPYQPTQNFMQMGDPIMKAFVNAAMGYQNEVINSGYTARSLQANFANQVQGLDLEAANLQNIMNGSRDDIRAEISKAGGFATESQIEGLVTTRNRDLLKQYNNIELQKETMQNQMNLQVGLAKADHDFAVDKFDNLTKTATLYKGIYDNATDQLDKIYQSGGPQALADISNGDPYYRSIIEQHLNQPSGFLSDPQKVAKVQTDFYKNQSLALSANRFNANYGYFPNGQGGSGGAPSSPDTQNVSGGQTTSGTGNQTTSGISYGQYGLLANTDFNPSNQNDKSALNYLNTYLNGTQPQNGSDIGISVRGAVGSQQYQAAVTRANNLYYSATGQNLPSPEIIKSNLGLISANNKLSNNLKIQENTVNANFGLSLQNLNANNLNSAYPILNGVINYIKNAEGDPAVAQYMAQNSTIQQELGNLLAVKNASGTTVYDKIAGAGLLPKNATPAQQVQVVKTLLQEAKNASNAFNQVNGDLYRQVDPLERQANNPNRYSTTKSGQSFNYLEAKNKGYNDKEIEDYIMTH